MNSEGVFFMTMRTILKVLNSDINVIYSDLGTCYGEIDNEFFQHSRI